MCFVFNWQGSEVMMELFQLSLAMLLQIHKVFLTSAEKTSDPDWDRTGDLPITGWML
jgi:hypothetical protein